ncbi:MAG TPA: hypothetical protein VMV10_33125 [Pirellulales bacterium]|nr:hypothetical protein [Pirellulales bacterium]
MRSFSLVFFALLSAAAFGSNAEAAGRPNILWLIAEDFGPELGCYGTKQVPQQNLLAIGWLAAEPRRSPSSLGHRFALPPATLQLGIDEAPLLQRRRRNYSADTCTCKLPALSASSAGESLMRR